MKSQELLRPPAEQMPPMTITAGLKSILERCRANPSRAFIPGYCTRARVMQLAASIHRFKKNGPVCICTADKALVAAALLAAAHDGPRLVLPHTFSRQALLETHESVRFKSIISDIVGLSVPGADLISPDCLTAGGLLPDGHCDADKPIVQIFTGGSTGKPRVWSKTLRNLFGEAGLLTQTFTITPEDIIASTVPPQHIYGLLFSVLVPLIANCSVLGPVYTFPQEILHALQQHKATVLISVPVQYHVLQATNLRNHNLRLAFSSAGVLNSAVATSFCDATGIDVTEIFGSTETGGIAWRQCRSHGPSWRPFNNVALKIMQERLLVRSDFLCLGLPLDTEGFFTTADRAVPSPDGSFILHGRLDDIVKVGGKRVDLAEVCNKILRINGVHDAVVFALPAHNGRGSDIAALIAGKIDTPELRLGLATVCEPFECPRHIRIVDVIPTRATGKHDREAIEAFFIS